MDIDLIDKRVMALIAFCERVEPMLLEYEQAHPPEEQQQVETETTPPAEAALSRPR